MGRRRPPPPKIITFGPQSAIPDSVAGAARTSAGSPDAAGVIGTIQFNETGNVLPLSGCVDGSTITETIVGTYAAGDDDIPFELDQHHPDYELRVTLFNLPHTGFLGEGFVTDSGYSGTFTITTADGTSSQATVEIPDRFTIPACMPDGNGMTGPIGTMSLNATEPRDITACYADIPSPLLLGTYFNGTSEQFFGLENLGTTYSLNIDILNDPYSGNVPATDLETPEGGLNGLIEISNGTDDAFAFININSLSTIPDC